MGIPLNEPKKYFIHDNGCNPFYVWVDDLHLTIYKQGGIEHDCLEDECDCAYELFFQQLVGEYDCQRIFIGKSPKNAMTEYSGGHGPEYDGNSILALLSNDGGKYKYLYIGSEIYTFETELEIVLYLSHVGNNDVPYPYGINTEGQYILFLEQATIYPISPYNLYYDDDNTEDLAKLDTTLVHGRNCF
jgi:hypothetical protein